MELNKKRIAKLTVEQANSIRGGGHTELTQPKDSADSTRHMFTCCYCSTIFGIEE